MKKLTFSVVVICLIGFLGVNAEAATKSLQGCVLEIREDLGAANQRAAAFRLDGDPNLLVWMTTNRMLLRKERFWLTEAQIEPWRGLLDNVRMAALTGARMRVLYNDVNMVSWSASVYVGDPC